MHKTRCVFVDYKNYSTMSPPSEWKYIIMWSMITSDCLKKAGNDGSTRNSRLLRYITRSLWCRCDHKAFFSCTVIEHDPKYAKCQTHSLQC